MSETVRVRFAPSPTGSLHLGGVRTALYNYLLARHYKGQFIIRVEDTDLERNQSDAAEKQLADLKWLGLDWDEGPDIGGQYGPYRQSERTELYLEHAQQLLEQGKAFYCFLTDEELDGMHSHENRQIKSPYRDMSLGEAKQKADAGEQYVIRYKNDLDDELFEFDDIVHGMTKLKGDMVGDFVLIRSNGHPVYNFCCVVDDHMMNITHVLRGEEHLSNTLRQVMVYRAFNWSEPRFGHLSMILGANRKKLSKRDDAVAMKDFIQGGYLPQALLNYVALLGWSHQDSEEKFQLEEMIHAFSMDRVNKSPAMFDRGKLNWLNHYHMNQLPSEEVFERMQFIYPSDVEASWFNTFWKLIGHQFHTLAEVDETITLFRSHQIRDQELILGEGKSVVESFIFELEQQSDMSEEIMNDVLAKIGRDKGVKGRRLFAPIRVALIGIQSGMELKILAALMNRDEMLKRAQSAISGE